MSNIYLTIAERSGLPALAAYLTTLSALALVLWPALRSRSAAPDDGLLPGLVAALVATQVAGLVDHHFVRFPHLIALLWIVAALAVAVASDQFRVSDSEFRGAALQSQLETRNSKLPSKAARGPTVGR